MGFELELLVYWVDSQTCPFYERVFAVGRWVIETCLANIITMLYFVYIKVIFLRFPLFLKISTGQPSLTA